MTTTSQLIERTKRRLYSGEVRDARDKLAAAVATVGATTVTSTFTNSAIQRGSVLAIDLEELYVEDVAGATVTVARGDGGSTAATHAEDTPIFINPKFTAFAILEAVNEELDALSAEGLFKVGTLSLTFDAGTDSYDLTGLTDAAVHDIIAVEYDANDGTERWATLPRSLWRLRRGLPSADFASTMALTINGGNIDSGVTVRVVYKTTFTALATISDNVETVSGLHAQAHDILVLGAAIRLTAGAEVSRNFLDQSDTRRADEVPPTARLGQMRALLNLRQKRVEEEKARLYRKYPVVR